MALDPKTALTSLGWKITDDASLTRAIKDFQRGWALGDALVIDGKVGTNTRRALQISLDHKAQKKGTASAHFSFSEFKCHCGGKYAGCATIRVHRGLLTSLERYRSLYSSGGMRVVSGYRCPRHNQAIHGASSSQHLYGSACDIDPIVNYRTLAQQRIFAGIGYKSSTKKVSHVDRRDVGGNNTTGGTKDRPTTWIYSS